MLGRWNSAPWLERLARWRYSGGTRDERLDLLRGFAVLAMVVDHIGGESSWLYAITGGDHFLISAAEAFVLIAGVTMGMVYRRLIVIEGPWAAVRKALTRSVKLYALTIALTIAFAGTSAATGAPWAPHVASSGWAAWILDVALLRQTYYLADIILMYAIIVAAAAPLLVLLARGHTRAVLVGSALLWGSWQFTHGVQIPWHIKGNDVFVIAAWQAVFVIGIVIGYHRSALAIRLQRLSPLAVAFASGATVAVVLVALALAPDAAGMRSSIGGMVLSELGAKADVPLARLVMLGLLMTFGFALTTVCWRPIVQSTGWLLMPLGQHSLLAYVSHLGVIVILGALLPTWGVARTAGETAMIQVLGLSLVWAVVLLEAPVRRLAGATKASMPPSREAERRPAAHALVGH